MPIARAFVNHPPLLLADEPTGNLDLETSIGIMQLIYRINRTGTTAVVAAHDKEMVDRCAGVIELREGRIVRDEKSGLTVPTSRPPSSPSGSAVSSASAPRAIPTSDALGLLPEGGAARPAPQQAPALAALLTVLLTALVLGVFIPSSRPPPGPLTRCSRGGGLVRADSATQVQQAELEALEATGNVGSVEYISKGEALAQAQERTGRSSGRVRSYSARTCSRPPSA